MMIDGRLQTMNRVQRPHGGAVAAGVLGAACLLAAVPGIAAAQERAPEVVRPGITRGIIGVHIECGTGDDVVTCPEAPFVVEVTAGSAAAKAGIRQRDKLVAINGRRINSVEGVRTIRNLTSGIAVDLELDRAGQPVRVNVIPQPPKGRARVFSFVPRPDDLPPVWTRRDSSRAPQADRFVFVGPDGRGSVAVRIADPDEIDSVLVHFAPSEVSEAGSAVYVIEDADLVRRVQKTEGQLLLRAHEALEELRKASEAQAPAAPTASRLRQRVTDMRSSAEGLIAGARFIAVTADMAENLGAPRVGCLVLRVLDDTPAARLGLQAGDVVTGVGGVPTGTLRVLQRELARAQAANELRVSWQRRGMSLNGVLVTDSE